MPSGHNVIAVEQTAFRHCVQMCTVALSSMKDFLNNTQCRKCQECQVDSNVASLFTNTTRRQGTNNHVHNLLNNTRGKFQDHLTARWTESRFKLWPSIVCKMGMWQYSCDIPPFSPRDSTKSSLYIALKTNGMWRECALAVSLDYKMHLRRWIKLLSLTMLINCSLSDVAPIFAFDRRRKVAEILRLQVIRLECDKISWVMIKQWVQQTLCWKECSLSICSVKQRQSKSCLNLIIFWFCYQFTILVPWLWRYKRCDISIIL